MSTGIERSREPQGKKTMKVKEREDKEEEKHEGQKRKEKGNVAPFASLKKHCCERKTLFR